MHNTLDLLLVHNAIGGPVLGVSLSSRMREPTSGFRLPHASCNTWQPTLLTKLSHNRLPHLPQASLLSPLSRGTLCVRGTLFRMHKHRTPLKPATSTFLLCIRGPCCCSWQALSLQVILLITASAVPPVASYQYASCSASLRLRYSAAVH